MADLKISQLTLAIPDTTDVIPFVDISDTTMGTGGTTKKATKADLKGDKGDAATVVAGTTTTLSPGSSATVVNVGTTADAIFDFGIPEGDKGDKGDQGDIGINWLGTYSGATTYVPNDAVYYNGSSYVCILSSTGNLPTNGTYWNLIAQKGADGTGIGDMLASVYDPDSNALPLQPQLECVSKTANYTAQPFELINCDVSAGSFTVTLPSAPADKTVIYAKLNGIGTDNYLTLACSGTDKFNTATGNTQIFMYLFGEYAQIQYCSSTGLWTTFISAGTFNFATQFPGVDATTPITEANITIDTGTRVLTITPPLGYFNIFSDGGGIITRHRKVGTINFPAFTDTSGIWYFYFNGSGTAVTTQTPWTADNFPEIVTIYRLVWNATLSGSAKLVAQYVEYHENTISADDHKWKHLYGAIWETGFDMKNNALTTGTPNADGRNTVIALTTGRNVDDNLEYTVTNDSTPTNAWEQDMGDIVPATLNATNSGQFKTFVQDAGGLLTFLPATRFPFAWDSGTNRMEYITSTGTRTLVASGDYAVYFVYATQNPVVGSAINIVSAPLSYGTITNARAVNWIDIQNTYPILGNDGEIRPLYRLIFLANTAWDDATKNARLYETQDLRKGSVTSTSTASGSLPASSVTVIPVGGIASTNVQSALEELDTEKAPLASPLFTGTITLADNTRIDLILPTADTYCTGNTTDSFASGYSSAVGDLVFFGSGGKWLEVDADAVATCKGLIGIALEAKTDTQIMKVALPGSFVRLDSWNWTVGVTLYAGETLGAMQEAIPTGADAVIKVVGFAVSADVIFFQPSSDQSTTVA